MHLTFKADQVMANLDYILSREAHGLVHEETVTLLDVDSRVCDVESLHCLLMAGSCLAEEVGRCASQ